RPAPATAAASRCRRRSKRPPTSSPSSSMRWAASRHPRPGRSRSGRPGSEEPSRTGAAPHPAGADRPSARPAAALPGVRARVAAVGDRPADAAAGSGAAGADGPSGRAADGGRRAAAPGDPPRRGGGGPRSRRPAGGGGRGGRPSPRRRADHGAGRSAAPPRGPGLPAALPVAQARRRLLPSVRLLRYLARRDRAAIDHYQQARADLDRERERLVARRRETEQWIRSEQARRGQLVAVREHKQQILARVVKEGQSLTARATELQDKEKKLAAFLDFLAGKNPGSPAGTPIEQFRGVLDWPAEGRVTAGFGSTLDPRYRTKVPHTGVDLAVAPGAEVKAVFPGKVLFAAPFQGYGNTVIVQHPGRVFTLYAGL